MLKGKLKSVSQLTFLIATTASFTAQSAVSTDTYILREAVTLEGVRSHQATFQAAADANGGTREASSPGYQASVAYVAGKCRPQATRSPFSNSTTRF